MRPNNRPSSQPTPNYQPLQRIQWWYVLLAVVAAVCLVRLFYLQVIRHDYYQKAALRGQLKQYEIPAERGIIVAHAGDNTVPIVLNETLYTLFADPVYVKDPADSARKLAAITKSSPGDYEKLLKTTGTRYVILAKKLNRDQKARVDKLAIKGIGAREATFRTYPDGQMAAQLLGFVNDDGEGKYGLEEALNDKLGGTPGQLKAITDSQGVPLPANKDNLVQSAVNGQRVLLTIDVGIQQQAEDILASAVESTKSKSGSVVVLDAKSGAVRAMANFPTYNPKDYAAVKDADLFNNASVSDPIEVGSIMKTLTTAAALDAGAVDKNQTYFDPSFYKIDGATVRNVEEDGGPGTKSVRDILKLSLNTGATWLLMQMGGGKLNEQGRMVWHEYLTNHYNLGKKTGIEQGFEAEGSVPDPKEGFGLNIQYANTTFGQGLTATTLQMAAAMVAASNGGTYYKPHLVEAVGPDSGNMKKIKPVVVRQNVVKPDVSQTLREMMEYTYAQNYRVYGGTSLRPEFAIGGKTGTAEITKPGGGYYDDRYNGTYLGYVGGDTPEYVIAIKMTEPKIRGYAGAQAAAPVFIKLVNTLIDSHNVSPKSASE